MNCIQPRAPARRDVQVAPVVGLDLVDRRQDLPADAVLDPGGLVDRQQEDRHAELADHEVGDTGPEGGAGEGVHERRVGRSGGAVVATDRPVRSDGTAGVQLALGRGGLLVAETVPALLLGVALDRVADHRQLRERADVSSRVWGRGPGSGVSGAAGSPAPVREPVQFLWTVDCGLRTPAPPARPAPPAAPRLLRPLGLLRLRVLPRARSSDRARSPRACPGTSELVDGLDGGARREVEHDPAHASRPAAGRSPGEAVRLRRRGQRQARRQSRGEDKRKSQGVEDACSRGRRVSRHYRPPTQGLEPAQASDHLLCPPHPQVEG